MSNEIETRKELREEVADSFRAFVAETGGGEDWSRSYYDHADRTIALVRAAAWQEFEAAMLEAAGERTIEMKVTIPALPKNIVSNRSAELRPFVVELLAAIAPEENDDAN